MTPMLANLLAVVMAATAQLPPQGQLADTLPVAEKRAAVPWGTGERLEYEVRFSAIRVGQASMEIMGVQNIRGQDAWHAQFKLSGRAVFYRVNDVFNSWIDVGSLASLRFHSDIEEGRRKREKQYEIFPSRRVYQELGQPEQPSVALPLDDASFLYFIRTVPLEVGKTYEFNRYFRPDRNPVKITVLRKEKVRVPAGEYDAIVVRPSIKTSGIFSEGGEAEVWLTDDPARYLLQIKSKLPFGSINLYLRSIRPATATQSR
jgi:hypothetical protein